MSCRHRATCERLESIGTKSRADPQAGITGLAAKSGLIDDVDRWMDFHAARNQTSHTYNRAIAQSVFDMVPQFAHEARGVFAQLEKRND